MGGIFSYLMTWISPSADDTTPDPNTGLTERDRQLISETWSMIADKKNIKENGVELLIQLFQKYPYMQDFFKQFKGMPLSEVRTAPKMRAHALGVMNMLTSYVQNLDDVETLVALITKVAISHKARNIKGTEFENLKSMMPSYLKSILGTKFTKEAEEAWVKLLTTHNVVLIKAMESADNAA